MNLQDYLLQFNVDIQKLKKKITIDSYWNQIIYDKYGKNIKIDLDQIKKNIVKKSIQKEYNLSEIVFNINLKKNLRKNSMI